MNSRHDAICSLLAHASVLVETLVRNAPPADIASELPGVLRLVNYLEESEQLAAAWLPRREDSAALADPAPLRRFQQALDQLLDASDCSGEQWDPGAIEHYQEALASAWRRLKDELLSEAARGALSVQRASSLIDSVRNAQQAGLQGSKAALRLAHLQQLQMRRSESDTDVADGPSGIEPAAP